MDALWLHLLVGVLAGCAGAGLVLLVRDRPAAPGPPLAAETPAEAPADPWTLAVRRCEQAVHRAEQAVDAMSSRASRNRLQAVVRRMDAELPDVRVLAELGKGLTGDTRRDIEVAGRVRAQLADTGNRFAEVTEQVLEVVAEPEHVDRRASILRERFPLVQPLSAVLSEPVSAS
ncbi:hypothetical protein GCM10009854_00790 [Saccharopolyspora halophila]|uniref:Secreted protein n=1 Tax=Saccharopolyspora halophila TaxID=405551 RepID=A0ABN3FHC5_9PSEU